MVIIVGIVPLKGGWGRRDEIVFFKVKIKKIKKNQVFRK